ncbi:hypothetical protein [uncultured Tyzzerella sp.]|uniref:hypothetical protein n=1 Tax=uncultured Tyzzerella sp. TaxID=2321398 RepID=UPI002941CE59|nr:hypothetical protein [uncultured Tyzzerella sp.]
MISSDKDNLFDNTLEQETDNSLSKSHINLDYTDEPQKKGLLSRFLLKFRQEEVIDSRQTLKDYDYEYSKFREYVFLLGETEDDENVLKAIELCDDSLKLDRHRLYLEKKKKECEIILEDLDCYNNLSKEDAQHLKSLITKFIQLNTERKGIRYQIGDFDNGINKLETLEEDAQDALYQIEDAENSKRLLSRDISLIKDEKERTILDRERLQFAYKVLHKFSFAISIVLGLFIVVLALISVYLNESVFLSLSILCITLVFTIVLIYIFRRKIVFELKLNEKKHSKLVSLLNKKTVVYSYYVNFLNYTYQKYNVKNSRILKANLEDFNNYKHVITRYDNLGKLVYEVQGKLEDFLKDKKITISNGSLEAFAKSINIDNKIAYFKEIELKKQKIEERIKGIEEEHQQLIEKIVALNVEDTSKEKVIEKIIKAYFNETEKLLSEEDEENFKKEEFSI